MKEEKKFLRQCVSCREYKQRHDLIRVTKSAENGEIFLNLDNKIQGRSIYVCKNHNCIEKLLKNKKIVHSLRAELPENIKVKLATVLPD